MTTNEIIALLKKQKESTMDLEKRKQTDERIKFFEAGKLVDDIIEKGGEELREKILPVFLAAEENPN